MVSDGLGLRSSLASRKRMRPKLSSEVAFVGGTKPKFEDDPLVFNLDAFVPDFFACKYRLRSAYIAST